MTNRLLKLFIKDENSRESYGFFSGCIGIASNLLLFILKLTIGIFTNSISIMTDAINNLSDSASSLITVFGFKMASKPSDEEHPYGHGRIEYISGLLVSCIVFVIGAQFFINSLKKTLSPENTNFNWAVGALLLLSIAIKFWQSSFYKTIGNKINSKVLLATAVDSRNDVITTFVVLISAIVEHFSGLKLDGPAGMLVSIFVIYSGVELLRDTLTPLLGHAPNKNLVSDIKIKILEYPTVIGIHDLILHNYGPDNLFATAHVEMPASQNIMESHDIIDEIERIFLRDENINLVIHLDPVDTNNPELDELQDQLEIITKQVAPELSVHDIRISKRKSYTKLLFDVTVPTGNKYSDDKIRELYEDEIAKIGGEYQTVITIDRNYISTVD